jgi:arylsulfatase A-like enzyme
MKTNRRDFLKNLGLGSAALALGSQGCALAFAAPPGKPNIILAMSDDLGWGDTAYNGHPVLQTPNLDLMAANGIRFDRFYAGAPVCSPTRGSAITGRHPFRYGIVTANKGKLKSEELPLSEALKPLGYATGHFGKWHMGTLTTDIDDSNRGGPGSEEVYAPPWDNGFDVCFSTEAKVPTWDPMINPTDGLPYGTHYWTGPGVYATTNLDGDDSRVIMDRAIPFIQQQAAAAKPFLAVIWFHTPHKPVVAGPTYRAMYASEDDTHGNYHGCITAMDEQIGRLRAELNSLGIAQDTVLWFCSDNGPENSAEPGSAGPFRGRKRDLYEGGVRVPGLLEWPDKIPAARVVDMACSTLDYFPTIMDVLGYQPSGRVEPIDGVSLLPLIEGAMTQRPSPIGFEHGDKVSLTDNQYKLYSNDGGATYKLFDIPADPHEDVDLAASNPAIVAQMRDTLDAWRQSCANSAAGNDYNAGVPDDMRKY